MIIRKWQVRRRPYVINLSTTWHSTRMIPFGVQVLQGESIYPRAICFAKKALVFAYLPPADSFPSV
jgi:hypothetical protein